MPGFQSTRLATEGALEPFFFLYTDDSIQGNPETCKQSSIMLNYEVKNSKRFTTLFMSLFSIQIFLSCKRYRIRMVCLKRENFICSKAAGNNSQEKFPQL